MKKHFVALLFLGVLTNGFSESILRDVWQVKSDKKIDTIPSTVCIVTGRAYDVYSEIGVSGAVVSNLDRSSNTVTRLDGTYTLRLSARDTAIFFYHPSYTEIVCWKYEFKGGHHVVMDFLTSEKLPNGMMYLEEKPVIYAYSNQLVNAELRLSNVESLTFTYPFYNKGWNIEVSGKGIQVDEKMYPYLFWEGEQENLHFESNEGILEADFINTDSSITYLENSLAKLGLNEKESTDFITYWGPRLQKKQYATVQFLVDEQYDQQIGELTVIPKPDAKRRVYMLFEGSDQDRSRYILEKQQYGTFSRKGFTIIEWGGTEFKRQSDI